MSKRIALEVNAGSMADIAFLLLIFFLVTTTIDKDMGIMRQLPTDIESSIVDINERNILEIQINKAGELFVDEQIIPANELSKEVMAFIDNGGAPEGTEGSCSYCKGNRNALSSDRPEEAIVSLQSHREAPYNTYVQVQNEISKAYNSLRNRESQRLFNYNYTLMKQALDEGSFKGDIEKAKTQLKQVRELFPMKLSEAETKNSI